MKRLTANQEKSIRFAKAMLELLKEEPNKTNKLNERK